MLCTQPLTAAPSWITPSIFDSANSGRPQADIVDGTLQLHIFVMRPNTDNV